MIIQHFLGPDFRVEVHEDRRRNGYIYGWFCSACWDAPGAGEPSHSKETVLNESSRHVAWHKKGEKK